MTERWQRELEKLRQLEPPSTAWSRVKQGPRSRALEPSSTGRVVAGVVAFAVFAVAGVFAWVAFSGQPTTVGRLGPPGEQVVRIDLTTGTDGDLAAVLRSGTVESTGTRFPVDLFGTGGAWFQAPDLLATYPPAGFAPVTPNATFRLEGQVQRGSVNAFLFRAEEIRADPTHLGTPQDLTHGEGRLTWALGDNTFPHGAATNVGNRYLLAIMGRSLTGEEFGFSFGVVIEEDAAVPTPTPNGAEVLVGREYADYLGLQLLNAEPADCNAWYTVKGKTGYCLDDVAGDTVETWIVVERLRGHLPTDREIEIFALQTRIGNLGSSPEDKKVREQLIARLVELQADAGIDIPESNATIPNVALIRCTESGTELQTPVVRPQADGVHIEVENQSRATAISALTPETSPSEGGLIAEFGADTGEGTLVLAIPPSRYLVTCLRDRGKEVAVDSANEPTLDVIDVDSVWLPTRPSCADVDHDRLYAGPQGESYAGAEELIRNVVPGVRDTDAVGPAGYPEATRGQHWYWRIERSGEVVAVLNVIDTGPAPTAFVKACSDSGIGEGK